MKFPYSKKICEIDSPLDWTDDKNQLMAMACKEMALFHQKNCPDIERLYKKHQFDPNSIESIDDLTRIPAVGVSAMKYHLLTSMPPDQAVLKLTSSGTRGQKTQIWFDQGSLDRVQRMLDVYLEQEKIVSKELTNYLVFNYDPDDAGDLGIAYTEKNQLRFAPQNKAFFTVKKDKQGQWQFLKEKALQTLKEYAQEGKPVRIMAMPAFLFEFLGFMKKQNISFKLPKGSLIITGGGWKAAEDKMVSRDQFRQMCKDAFGIPAEWIRDAYGMAEHSAPYFQCSHHKFHVAVFNRLYVRDPVTNKVLPPGEKGLLELVTPFNAIMPTLALLSTDWAMIDSESCGCGQNSPTFTLLGRAGLSKHKGCAIHADDIVKRGK